MSDWGGSQGWLSESELARAGCGKDCHCTNQTCRMARELRSLRTRPAEPQGLTEEEREALEWLRTWSGPRLDISASGHNDCDCDHCENARRAIATLDRLLSCAEVRR